MKKNDAKENQSSFNWRQPSFVVEENIQAVTTKLSKQQLGVKQKRLEKCNLKRLVTYQITEKFNIYYAQK